MLLLWKMWANLHLSFMTMAKGHLLCAALLRFLQNCTLFSKGES